MTKRHIEAFLAKGCLSLLAASLAFIAVELLARNLINPLSPIEQQFPVQHYRQPRPYVMFSGKHSAHELNNMGYRGAAPPSHKEPGEYRIFFLGGSTVVNGSPPISDLVQHLFTRHDMPQVKVYNFGVVSSVSSMEIVKIVMEIVDLSPDMIVMYNGGNDILHPYSYDPRPGYPFNFAVYERNVLLERPSDYPALSLLAFESVILRKMFRNYFINEFIDLESIRQDEHYLSEEWKQDLASIYVNNLLKARKTAGAFDAEFFVFFQPLIYFKNPLSSEEELLLRDRSKADFCIEMRQMILKKLSGLNHLESYAVDLSKIYEGDTRHMFVDTIHTMQDGKAIVATAIFDHIFPHVSNGAKR